jgi:hypothetical protein
MDNDLVLPSGNMDGNPGLEAVLSEQSLDPRMVNHIDEIMADLMTMEAYVTPDYIDTDVAMIEEDANFDFSDLVDGGVYHIVCESNQLVSIPDYTVLDNVAIVSDCRIAVGSDVQMTDVVLASLSGGNNGASKAVGSNPNSGHGAAGVESANIRFASNSVLGADDNCALGGGVQIFSNASVHFSSGTTYNGVQIVAAGDVNLGARIEGINGLNVQAGHDITMTSNNAIGLCSGGAPQLFTVDYYRLVY